MEGGNNIYVYVCLTHNGHHWSILINIFTKTTTALKLRKIDGPMKTLANYGPEFSGPF